MELNLSSEEAAFRDEVRAFIAENYPAEMRVPNPETDLSKEQMLLWHRILHRKGWIAPLWPKEHGGPGWSITQRFIFEQETSRAGTLPPLAFSVTMVGPVIYTFGNDAQKQMFLPRILSGEDWWCQGYSEPGSGSDLASLQTRAVRDGDDYVVTGQKIWTTLAHYADWIFCLVRTDPNRPKRQEGISFLLIDMRSPGISVRPITLMDGSHEVNAVFFDDVRVPIENRVHDENDGWTVAKYLLEFERGGNPYSPRLRSAFERLKRLSHAMPDGEESIMADVSWREKLARMDIEISGLEMFEQEFYSRLASGQNPGPLSSMIKLRGTEVMQQVQESAVEAAGYYAQPFPEQRAWNANVEPIGPEGVDVLAPRYFNGRKMTIYGGSSEVQRGIMSKVMLGL
jgi:hypothetical protein